MGVVLIVFMDNFRGHFLHKCSITEFSATICVIYYDHVITSLIELILHVGISLAAHLALILAFWGYVDWLLRC